MGSIPHCYLCTGKDCRRDDGFKELSHALHKVARVKEVDCQDLCDGPVAGVIIDGDVEWFEKVRKERYRDAVVDLVLGKRDDIPNVLKARWAKKYSGKVKH